MWSYIIYIYHIYYNNNIYVSYYVDKYIYKLPYTHLSIYIYKGVYKILHHNKVVYNYICDNVVYHSIFNILLNIIYML